MFIQCKIAKAQVHSFGIKNWFKPSGRYKNKNHSTLCFGGNIKVNSNIP